MQDLQATTTFEVEISLTGSFLKGYAATGPTYSSGSEPGVADTAEDVEVVDFGGITYERAPTQLVDGFWIPSNDGKWVTKSLFEGVDIKSPDIQRFLANVLQYVGENQCTQALLEGM